MNIFKALGKLISDLWHSPAVTLIRHGAEAAAKQAAIQACERAALRSFETLVESDDAQALAIKAGSSINMVRAAFGSGRDAAAKGMLAKLENNLAVAAGARMKGGTEDVEDSPTDDNRPDGEDSDESEAADDRAEEEGDLDNSAPL